MIERELSQHAIALFERNPVLTITGPRQSGKTTLARNVFADLPYVNLEDLETRELAETDPLGFFANIEDGAIIDEIQRIPRLLSQIQTIVDDDGRNGMFVLTGSAQFELMESISQTLAGRTALLRLLPLSIAESALFGEALGLDELMFRGFNPRIYDHEQDPTTALADYIETYVERDLRSFAQIRNLSLFRRFMKLCAGRVGQLLNINNLANDVGVSSTTIRQWISILEASYIVFILQPYHANIRKRLVKTPKLYFTDVGLASYLLGIENSSQIGTHPLRGGLFENMMIMEILKHRFNRGKRANLSFFRDSKGNEVDLLLESGGKLLPVEIKSAQTVIGEFFDGFTSMKKSLTQNVERGLLVYAGKRDETRSDADVTNPHCLSERLGKLGY